MAEKAISQLPPLAGSPRDDDVYPLVNNGVTQKITYSTLYNSISTNVVVGKYVSVATYNNSQTFLSNASGNWQSTYTTVTANSAAWNSSPLGYTIFREVSSTASPNNSVNVYALSVFSPSANVDVALCAKGTGATLAQIPTNDNVGGAKRGNVATDWQKERSDATQVASGPASTIGGGYNNTASGSTATIAGGGNGVASGIQSTIGGGTLNVVSGTQSTIGGGYDNSASNDKSTVGGGHQNRTTGYASTIGGGYSISATGNYSMVGGGLSNTVSQSYATIGGGTSNTASQTATTVGGGQGNTASNTYAFVGGGYQNTASGYSSVVVGGSGNTASGIYSFIGGGVNNSNGGLTNTHILGSNLTATLSSYTYVNNISAPGVVTSNNALFNNLTGINTRVTNITGVSARFESIIGGGGSNTASGYYSTVLGGDSNTASGSYSFIGGGYFNSTNSKDNAHILGSYITAPSGNHTYVNNLSTPGRIVGFDALFTNLTGTNTRVADITGSNALFTNLTGTSTTVIDITGSNALFTNLTGTNTTSTTISAATYQGVQATKAWVNFDGTGTTVGNNATLNAGASYNINYVRKIGIGTYGVVFLNQFPNTYYMMSGSCSGDRSITPVISAGGHFSSPVGTTKTALSCVVMMLSGATSSTKADSKDIGLMFIGS